MPHTKRVIALHTHDRPIVHTRYSRGHLSLSSDKNILIHAHFDGWNTFAGALPADVGEHLPLTEVTEPGAPGEDLFRLSCSTTLERHTYSCTIVSSTRVASGAISLAKPKRNSFHNRRACEQVPITPLLSTPSLAFRPYHARLVSFRPSRSAQHMPLIKN